MDSDLTHRLLLAESDFLDSLQNGPHMLASFRQTLSVLPEALSTARKTGKVTTDTLSLAHSVASRISKVASCFLDITRGEQLSTAQLQRDCDAMFQQMASLNLDVEPTPILQENVSHSLSATISGTGTVTPTNTQNLSPLVSNAYPWLVENLHNPYPPGEVKSRIATISSCQIFSVNSWFANARRRIGWTTLRRKHFSNSRADMIDAAYRALVEEDSERPLPPEVSHAFIAMKVVAEGLYSSTLARNTFTGDLDAMLKDVTKGEAGKGRHVEAGRSIKVTCDPYPSPNQSLTASPASTCEDSLTDRSEEEEGIIPTVLTGFKRRRSFINSDVQSSSSDERPIKRLCGTSRTSQVHLPSPPSSTVGIDTSSDRDPRELGHPAPLEAKEVPFRKRRLSDTDPARVSKRPCCSTGSPRSHTVPDPLPSSDTLTEYSIDDWLNTDFDSLFDIPPPVDATEPDLTSSWEVELFSGYNIHKDPTCGPAATAPADTHLIASADLSDLDTLLRSIDGDASVAPEKNVPLSDTTGLDAASGNLPVPGFLQTDVDWSFLDGPGAEQPTICSMFPQFHADSQPLPEIDLSMLQLPLVMPSLNSQAQGNEASKQEKLRQLHAMQEAVRQMEQELQSEGIVL